MPGLAAIIGGTGVYDPGMLEKVETVETTNIYGKTVYYKGIYKGREVIFQPRHGSNHQLPPHAINYRANIMGLKEAGVTRVIATAAVGSMSRGMPPGSAVLIDQFIDHTRQRVSTFFEGGEEGVVHTDFTVPYCPQLRSCIKEAGQGSPLDIVDYGTYVCTEGPRFETPAEITMFKSWGGDLAGMTNAPEVMLAREAGLCYATICFVTNYAAGISRDRLSHQEVLDMMAENIDHIRELIMGTLDILPGTFDCHCREFPGKMGW